MSIFNSITAAVRHLRLGARMNPVRDWFILAGTTAALLAGIVIWNLWTFGTVAGGGTIGATVTNPPPPFSLTSLNTIHTIFTNRAVEESNYESGVYSFADPSQ